VYRVLVGKPKGKGLLERLRHRWEDGIRMRLREIGSVCVRVCACARVRAGVLACGVDSADSGWFLVVGSRECDGEPFGFWHHLVI
jgi:hypothetical protein